MDATITAASTGILDDGLELASWNRQRTGEELRRFVETRHAALPIGIEVE